jgi:hypothetical protein
MRNAKQPPQITVNFRPVSEWTDEQLERLIGFGKIEAELLDQLEAATAAGDRDLAWQISLALVENIRRVERVSEELKRPVPGGRRVKEF